MGIKHNHTATGTNDGTKQVSVTRWNEDHVIVDQIDIPLIATPVAPATDNVGVFGRKIAGRMMLAQIGPSGLDTTFQPNLGGNKVAMWMPPGNATTVPGVFGMGALTAIGTPTARNVATTNLLTRMTRMAMVSAAGAGNLAGYREPNAKYTVGAGSGLGGFFTRIRFGTGDAAAVAGARMFVGMSASTAAPTNVEPNTLLNSIGVAQLSTSNNLHIVHGGTTANAAIDLGAGFPANTLSADAYELALFAPTAGNVFYQLSRLNTGTSVSGQITTNLPLSTVLLCHQMWRCNNATALAVVLDICGIYIETDY
ncbi:MAG TPA: hypothetical protein VE869_18425 [Gemmatimonas sp.]|nr:hypothetical protein [Gemmatimonas sp.]